MKLIDFSEYPSSDVQYGGSERKEAILVPNGTGNPTEYMLSWIPKNAKNPRTEIF